MRDFIFGISNINTVGVDLSVTPISRNFNAYESCLYYKIHSLLFDTELYIEKATTEGLLFKNWLDNIEIVKTNESLDNFATSLILGKLTISEFEDILSNVKVESFKEGYATAQSDFRKLLGVKDAEVTLIERE